MTIPVEIMLRGNDRVFTESVVHPGEPGHWTAADLSAILKNILTTLGNIGI